MAAKISLPIVEDRRPMRNRTTRRRHRCVTIFAVVAIALFGLYNLFPKTSSTYASRVAGYYNGNSNYNADSDSPSYDTDVSTSKSKQYQHQLEQQNLHNDQTSLSTSSTTGSSSSSSIIDQTSSARRDLVPLEAHIISKCPDTRDCLKDLVLPAMMHVSPKVNFTLSYIGVATENDGVDCMHGPAECMGNIIELCAAELYPDPKIYLGFTMCLTRDYKHIPQRELVEDCALEHGIDFSALNECAARDDGAHGTALLRSSVKRTAKAGVKKSCTVRLDDEIYCIRDGGQWSDCPSGPGVNDLVVAVEKLYRGLSSS